MDTDTAPEGPTEEKPEAATQKQKPNQKAKKKALVKTQGLHEDSAGPIDQKTLEEIPPEVLQEALGAGARRSGRKTKARVVMIDGEPVLRSNAYDMAVWRTVRVRQGAQ